MDTVSFVNLTAHGYSALVVDSYEAFHSTSNLAPQHGSPPVTRINHMEANLQTVPRYHDVYSDHCLVAYIHNYPQNKSGGSYFLKFSCETGQLTILECIFCKFVIVFGFVYIHAILEAHILHTKQEAKLAYDNYKQDCLISRDTVCRMKVT